MSDQDLNQSIRDTTPRTGGYKLLPKKLFGNNEDSECDCEWEDEVDNLNLDELESFESIQSVAPDQAISYASPEPEFNVIANVITVVMLLASENPPTDFQIQYAVEYLETVKDEEGITPPNIQGLLNHITWLRGGQCTCKPE